MSLEFSTAMLQKEHRLFCIRILCIGNTNFLLPQNGLAVFTPRPLLQVQDPEVFENKTFYNYMNALILLSSALVATCWAAMMFYGRSGYVEATKKIVETQRYIEQEYSKLNYSFDNQ